MMLKDRIALITGAASERGIGRASARLFACHGARVGVLDLDQAACDRAARDLGDRHGGFACDVTRFGDCEDAVQQALSQFGGIDILVNNAGITQPLALMEITEADYVAVADVSLKGTLLMSQAVIPHLRQSLHGSIICMSSVSAQRGGGIFGGPHYSAAKAGVLGLVKAMARELGGDGIRVNAIAPGLIQTDITAGLLDERRRQPILRDVPLARLGEPEDVARVCLFLASDLSGYITGAVIDVNGGQHMH